MRRYAQAIFRILRETIAHSKRTRVDVMAGSLAFTTILSIAPLLAVMFVGFQMFGLFDYGYEKLQPFLIDNLTTGAGTAVQNHLRLFLKKTRSTTVGAAGISGLLLTAILFYNQCTQALDQIFEVQQRRKVVRRLTKGALVIFIGPVLLAASLGITAMIATQIKFLPFSGSIIAIVINIIAFTLFYRFLPNYRIPDRILLETATIMGILFECAKGGYAFYAKRAVSYSKIYGSFAAIPLFFIWVYVSWYLVLLGASLARSLRIRKELL